MKLQAKVPLLLVPMLILPLVWVAWYSNQKMQQASEARVLQQVQNVVRQVQTSIENDLDIARRMISILALSPIVQEYITVEDQADRYALWQPTLLNLFASYAQVNTNYYEIRLLLPDGQEDARFSRESSPNIYEKESILNWDDIYNERPNIVIVQNPDNQETAFLATKALYAFEPGKKHYEDLPPLRGFLVITIRPNFLTQKVAWGVADGWQLSFFDQQDRPLVGGGAVPIPIEKNEKNVEKDGLWLMESQDNAKRVYEQQFIGLPLKIRVTIPAAAISADSEELVAVILQGSIISVLGMVAVVLLTLNRLLLKPLQELADAAEAISRGQWQIQLSTSRKDEIGILITRFQQMVNDIYQAQSRLETAVAVRTAKLQQAVSELVAAREKAEQANRLKSEFLANVSHEIRTPMNGVLGMLALALTEPDLSPKQRHYLVTAQDSAESLLTLMNSILDFSKIEAGKLTIQAFPFELNDIIHKISRQIKLLAHNKGLAFTVSLDEAVPRCVEGDPERIREVLLNFLSNALKFTQQGEIKLVIQRSQKLVDGAEHDLVWVRFSVEDTGIGIPADQLEAIFEAFTQVDGSLTRSVGGTGLGLAICEQLVLLMQGTLGVESELNRGSRFWFEIPLRVLSSADPEDPSSLPVGEPAAVLEKVDYPYLLLVVEDDLVNQEIAIAMLTQLGCTVDLAENGQIAVEMAKQRQYDLIFMDCQMPVLDGYQATQRIRGSGQPVIIIAMTAHAMKDDQEKCLESGMNDYLSKPFTQAGLQKKLQQWLVAKGHSLVNTN